MATTKRSLGSLIQKEVSSKPQVQVPQFTNAQAQEFISKADAVKSLQATESDNAEAEIEKLQRKLEAIGGKYRVPIHLIDPDPNQPRKTFPKAVVEERAESMARNGQLSPVILIPQENDRFILFEGELRWRGANKLAWEELDAVFLPSEGYQTVDADRFEKQMLTSSHAQRLHDLDLAEGIVRLVELRYPEFMGRSHEISKALNTAVSRLKRAGEIEQLWQIRNGSVAEQQQWMSQHLKEAEKPIFEVILRMQYHPVSILKNAFPLLLISDDLKELVRETAIESSKVKELHKLTSKALGVTEAKALQIRAKVARQAVEQQSSLSEVKAIVAQALQQHNSVPSKPQISPAIKKVRSIEVAGTDASELESLRIALLKKLKEVEAQLKNA